MGDEEISADHQIAQSRKIKRLEANNSQLRAEIARLTGEVERLWVHADKLNSRMTEVEQQRDQALAQVGELEKSLAEAGAAAIRNGTKIYLLMVENLQQDGHTESYARDAYATQWLAEKARDEATKRYKSRLEKMTQEQRHRHTIQTFSVEEITVTAQVDQVLGRGRHREIDEAANANP